MVMQITGGTVSDTAIDGMDYILDTPAELYELPGKLKFISTLFEQDVLQVSAGMAEEYTLPMDEAMGYELVRLDGEQAMEYTAELDQTVRAVKDGHVFYIGTSALGEYIRVNHNDGSYTLYYGVSPDVKTGDVVLAGQPIAHVNEENTYVQIIKNGTAVIPENYN